METSEGQRTQPTGVTALSVSASVCLQRLPRWSENRVRQGRESGTLPEQNRWQPLGLAARFVALPAVGGSSDTT